MPRPLGPQFSYLANMVLRRLAATSSASTSLRASQHVCWPGRRVQPGSPPCLGQVRTLLQTRSLLQSRHVVAAGGGGLPEELPEPGPKLLQRGFWGGFADRTPEAPPQVPPELGQLPGTDIPTEEIITPAPTPSVPALEPEIPLSTESQLSDVEEELISQVVDSAARTDPDGFTSAVAAAAEIAAAAEVAGVAPPSADAVASPEKEEFKQHWALYMAKLEELGIYTPIGPDGTPLSPNAAVKRASVECGRVRPDALYELDPQKIRSFASNWQMTDGQGALSDRKCVNSMNRLQASFLRGEDLPLGQGGAATFLDICRSVWAIHTDLGNPHLASLVPSGLASSGASLLPEIVSILSIPASAAGKARAEEAAALRQRLEDENASRRAQQRAERFQEISQPSFSTPSIENKRNFKPGDWACPQCNGHNFARNRECFRCRAPRPAESGALQRDGWFEGSPRNGSMRTARDVRPGDWMCPECNAHNFANKMSCYKCQLPRPEGAGEEMEPSQGRFNDRGGTFGERKQQREFTPRPGDWTCGECGKLNFARRHECFSCGASAADSGQPVSSQDFGGGFERGPPRIMRDGDTSRGMRSAPERRAGDWDCPECSAHNFASKEACYRCGIPKPPGSEYVPSGGRQFDSGRFDSGRSRGGRSPRNDRYAGQRASDSFGDGGEDLEW